jgi:hypothetical protein
MVSRNLEKNMHEWVFQRLSKLHESEGWVVFEVFEKLTIVCLFFKFHAKPYYYLLMIYMKKLCSHVGKSHLEIKKLRNLKNKKLRNVSFFCTVFHFLALYLKKLHCSYSQSELISFFMYIIRAETVVLGEELFLPSCIFVHLHFTRSISMLFKIIF